MQPMNTQLSKAVEQFKSNLGVLLGQSELSVRDKKAKEDLTIARMLRRVRQSNELDDNIKNNIFMQLRALIFARSLDKSIHSKKLENEEFNKRLHEEEEEEAEEEEELQLYQQQELQKEEQDKANKNAYAIGADLSQYFADIGSLFSKNLELSEKDFTFFNEQDISNLSQAILLTMGRTNVPTPEFEKTFTEQIQTVLDNALKNATQRLKKMEDIPQQSFSTLNNYFNKISEDLKNWIITGEKPVFSMGQAAPKSPGAQKQQADSQQPIELDPIKAAREAQIARNRQEGELARIRALTGISPTQTPKPAPNKTAAPIAKAAAASLKPAQTLTNLNNLSNIDNQGLTEPDQNSTESQKRTSKDWPPKPRLPTQGPKQPNS